MAVQPGELAHPTPDHTHSPPFRRWLREVLGLDRAIIFTVLARGWQSLAGLVTVALIAHFLSPAEQGYYYTFFSLVALQIVFELGFSFVIQQMASHERAMLTISPDYQISGDPVAHARLASVLQKSVRWYSAAAGLMAAFLICAGLYFFTAHQKGLVQVGWKAPWCCVALAATLTFQIDPLLAFLEGCGYVANVARLRLMQAATGSLLAWLALLSHHGLFAPAMMIVGTASTALVWLYRKRRFLLGLLRHHPGEHRIRWGIEVWPFQWKIAVSWLSGYFIFQLFNPVLFAYKGPVVAGQMGMSLSLSTALQSIAISWVNTKSAPFGAMIARKNYAQLDHTFFRALRQSLGVCLTGALVFLAGAIWLNLEQIPFAHRLLSPLALALLFCATTVNIAVFSEALYLRAHKQEKFLLNSVLTAILVAASTLFFGRTYGATGVISGYLATLLVVGLGLGTFTFMKYRKAWHAQ
jgi:O-antigen/teichoic acid export membrane protein